MKRGKRKRRFPIVVFMADICYGPAGTYRDVSYNAVDECLPCPPGRFREDSKGKKIESCYKCPEGTYSPMNGSDSILNCKRCPPGLFRNEPGSSECICIAPGSCDYEIEDHDKGVTSMYKSRYD